MYFKKGKKKHFLNVLNMQHIIFVSKIKKKKDVGFCHSSTVNISATKSDVTNEWVVSNNSFI